MNREDGKKMKLFIISQKWFDYIMLLGFEPGSEQDCKATALTIQPLWLVKK